LNRSSHKLTLGGRGRKKKKKKKRERVKSTRGGFKSRRKEEKRPGRG